MDKAQKINDKSSGNYQQQLTAVKKKLDTAHALDRTSGRQEWEHGTTRGVEARSA